MFKKKVRVSNINKPDLFFEEEFWIDTGALYSFVPEDYLQKIDLEPSATRNLVLADGRQQARLLGFCDFQIEGLEGNIPCPVIFAPKGSLLLLGATALENFGVEADPINKQLKPILAVIGGFLASSVERSVLGACQGPVVSKDGGLRPTRDIAVCINRERLIGKNLVNG